jgi:3-oxoacyl-[acyl-carrier-protein] synthase II
MAHEQAIVITSWGVVSGQGIGKRAFADSLASKKTADNCKIESFHAADYVGRKGTRVYDRITQFAVVATHEALQDAQADLPESGGQAGLQEAGVVLASTFGGLKSNCDFMKEVWQEKPHRIDASAFPSAVMNYAAGQVAIRFGLKGVNATLSGGRLASLQALQYADRCLKSGRARQIFAGGAEEWSEYLEWGFGQAGRDAARIGEGSAVMLLETLASAKEHRRKPLARWLGCSTRLLPFGYAESLAQEFTDSLANCIRTVLDQGQTRLSATDVLALYSSGNDDEWRPVEEGALREVFGTLPGHLSIREHLGDCYSAAGAFQLAAFLALAETAGKDAPRYGLLLSADQSGMVGCAVVERTVGF